MNAVGHFGQESLQAVARSIRGSRLEDVGAQSTAVRLLLAPKPGNQVHGAALAPEQDEERVGEGMVL